MGMATDPSLLTFGVGYYLPKVHIDLAFSRHEMLGYTPHFSLSYTFGTSTGNASETEISQQ
jgi:hypothetical protein